MEGQGKEIVKFIKFCFILLLCCPVRSYQWALWEKGNYIHHILQISYFSWMFGLQYLSGCVAHWVERWQLCSLKVRCGRSDLWRCWFKSSRTKNNPGMHVQLMSQLTHFWIKLCWSMFLSLSHQKWNQSITVVFIIWIARQLATPKDQQSVRCYWHLSAM